MSNYIPWYGKKQARLTAKRKKLAKLIKDGGSEEAIKKLAEEVAEAQIRADKAKEAQIPPRD